MGVDIPDATNWTGTYDVYMVIDDIGEVIAERTLKRSVDGEDPTDVIVRLGKPQPFPDDSAFYSPFEVVGLGKRKIQYAAGADAFHSLHLVLRMISALLHSYGHEPSVTMFFLEPGDDLGFRKSSIKLVPCIGTW